MTTQAKSIHAMIEAARPRFGKLERTADGHHGKYVPLEGVLAAVEEALKAERVSIYHQSEFNGAGWCLRTVLINVDTGEFLDSRFPLAKVDDPQKAGSGITYGRRYNLVALLNLSADDDDDGSAASRSQRGKGREGGGNGRSSGPPPERSVARRFYDALSAEFGEGPPWEIPGKRKLIKKLFGKFDTDLVREKLSSPAFVEEMGGRWEMALREVREELELEREEASHD